MQANIKEMVEKFAALNPKAKVQWDGQGKPFVRQGDTYVFFEEKAPAKLVKQARDNQNRAIVALGEVTGHAHAFEVETADIFVNPVDNVRWLLVEAVAPAPYVHEEHDTLIFPDGFIGRLGIQRELDLNNRRHSRPVWD